MILGRGTATSEEAIVAEYVQFLATSSGIDTPRVRERVAAAPHAMRRRIGKPVAEWTEADLLTLFAQRRKATVYGYCAFLAFLLFRGYRRASLEFLTGLHVDWCRMHRPALQPYREKLEAARQALGYDGGERGRSLVNLLIYLLVVAAKPLTELTRADFDAFRATYDSWYRTSGRRTDRSNNSRLTRLEYYLVHWGVIAPAPVTFKHDEHFAELRAEAIRQAILVYMRFCDAKYRPSTIHSCRAAVLGFFLWLQRQYPAVTQLDEVSRPMALAYAVYLKGKVEAGMYSPAYRVELYRRVRLFFDFAITEQWATAPARNPFARGDTPHAPDPVPRYLTDHDLQTILRYCGAEASLVERVVVMTMLHTGIRAAELAALKTTDVVQVQGRWKLHIHAGKGLKDRVIPLTEACLTTLRTWQAQRAEKTSDSLFTTHGRPWSTGRVCAIIRELGAKLRVTGLTPHRFRHTFAVALLNYGLRESALQKLMGHKTLNMTLEYARILDQTVERAFTQAVAQMQDGALSWVPSFFAAEEYTLFAQGDTVSWIRLPLGYCRRNPKLHCESDVKCLLCDRFAASPTDLPRLHEMHERFLKLGLQVKADVVAAQIRRLERQPPLEVIPLEAVKPPTVRGSTLSEAFVPPTCLK